MLKDCPTVISKALRTKLGIQTRKLEWATPSFGNNVATATRGMSHVVLRECPKPGFFGSSHHAFVECAGHQRDSYMGYLRSMAEALPKNVRLKLAVTLRDGNSEEHLSRFKSALRLLDGMAFGLSKIYAVNQVDAMISMDPPQISRYPIIIVTMPPVWRRFLDIHGIAVSFLRYATDSRNTVPLPKPGKTPKETRLLFAKWFEKNLPAFKWGDFRVMGYILSSIPKTAVRLKRLLTPLIMVQELSTPLTIVQELPDHKDRWYSSAHCAGLSRSCAIDNTFKLTTRAYAKLLEQAEKESEQ